MTGSVRDVHDRKVAELKNLDEIKRRDSFLAMLSHELRNPMGAALNAIDYDNRDEANEETKTKDCLLYTSPSPRDQRGSRMPSSA